MTKSNPKKPAAQIRAEAKRKIELHKRVNEEILFLHGLSSYDMNGDPIKGCAFGTAYPVEPETWGQNFTNYHYSIGIGQDGNTLELVIDTYTASGAGERAGSEWSVDAWEDGMLTITATNVCRKTYYTLARIARSLLSGRDVQLTTGPIKGLVGATASTSGAEGTLAEFHCRRKQHMESTT